MLVDKVNRAVKMRALHCLVFLTLSCRFFVKGRHPTCHFLLELQREEEECHLRLQTRESLYTKGCRGLWDNISCWDHAKVGETVTNPCPGVLRSLFGRNELQEDLVRTTNGGRGESKPFHSESPLSSGDQGPGNISKNCTTDGWSQVFPNITSVCGSEPGQEKLVFYMVVKTLYTLGHSLSLIALTTGSAILCLFRRLHCTRNYIHLNLFFSFILRAIAVLVKDNVLFSHNSQCSDQPSLAGCRVSLVFFHYFIMANFFWLLVEGLYLHTLLVAMFSENKHFVVYVLIGWGFPTVFVIVWIMTRIHLEDTGCWEIIENAIPKWVINGPIVVSIMVNFILFISIIRILIQKLRCPNVGGNDQSQYRRLAKSTLLLIPLFGVHYVVFVSLNDSMVDYKIFFDLAIGSFQGLVVAILYCFLNSEVQGELKRKWAGLSLSCNSSHGYATHSAGISRNCQEESQKLQRHCRAQSLLQTETSVL